MTNAGFAVPGRHAVTTSKAVERYFAAFLAVFLTLALTRFAPLEPRIKASLEVGMRGDIVKQVGYLALFIAALLPAIIYRSSRLKSAIPVAFSVFFFWCSITLFWSPVPDIAARRLTLTVIIMAAIFIATANLPPKLSIKITTNTLNALVLASLFACIAVPSLAIHQPGDPESGIIGDWRGIFYHKNIFGSVAAISALLNVYALKQNNRLFTWLFLLLSALALWMSGSKTSLGVGIASMVVMILTWRIERSRYKTAWMQAMLITSPLAVAGITWWFSGPGLQLLSDPEALTGRGRIWQMMAQLIADRPLGGIGYQSVFQIGYEGVMMDLNGKLFFQTLPHAHNGYLEITVSTGFIGLALFLWAFTLAFFGPLRRLQRMGPLETPLVVGIVAFAMIQALTESGIADRDRPVWMLLILALGILRRLDLEYFQNRPSK